MLSSCVAFDDSLSSFLFHVLVQVGNLLGTFAKLLEHIRQKYTCLEIYVVILSQIPNVEVLPKLPSAFVIHCFRTLPHQAEGD